MVEIVEARAAHIRQLAANLRAEDREEIEFCGRTTMAALWPMFRYSIYRRAALVGDEVMAVWGVAGQALGVEGRIWLMTSSLVEKNKLSFLKGAEAELAKALAFCPRLVVWTSPYHKRSHLLLDFLGFLREGEDSKLLRYAMERKSGD